MAKASPSIGSFNSGQLSPLVDARTDKDWYRSGCKKLQNFIPLVQGPAMRDPGTKYVAAVKNSAHQTWLGRFEFSAYEAYVLEFGDGYIRFFDARLQLNISAPTAYNGGTAYTIGDLLSYSGVNYYVKAATTGNVPPNATYYYPLTGTIYEIPAPWAVADLTGDDGEFMLDIAQKGDLLYITHKAGDYQPVKISRFSDTRWVVENLVSGSILSGGPFEDTNEDTAVTVYASAATGSVTLTASSAVFAAGHVGGLFYLERKLIDAITAWEPGKAINTNDVRRSNGKNYIALNSAATGVIQPNHTEGAQYDGSAGVQWGFLDPGYGVCVITAFTSSVAVTATVLSRIPDGAVLVGNASHRWAHGMFSAAEGWPTHVAFFRERLTFCKDQTVVGSVAGEFENFSKFNDSGAVTIEQSWQGKIAIGQPDSIKWMAASPGALLIGTTGAELACSELTTVAAFGPGNIKIEHKTSHGSRGVTPEQVDDSTMFVQRSGRMLRAMRAGQDGLQSADMSVRNDQITIPQITSMTFQREPWSVVWFTLKDGALLGLTYNEEQQVIGWHAHTVGGSFGSGAAVVESVACIPSPTNDRDDLWMIVKRTINGATKRYVEVLMPEYRTGDDADSAFYVRSGLTYDLTPATTISGLDHLEGQTVAVLADGSTHPDSVVTSGAITLQRSASVVHVGLPYRSILQTMRLEAGASDGTAQGKIKRINHAIVRFFNTLGAKAGPTESKLDTIQFRSGSDDMDSAPPIFTGDKQVPWPGDYETDAHLVIVQDQPLPMTVVGIFPSVVTQDRG